MAKALSRSQILKQLMPGLNKLFVDEYAKYSERKVYEVIQRGDTFDVHEHSVGIPDDVVLATGLTEKELEAILNMLPDDEQHIKKRRKA
jgi:hypothetical protein